MGKSLPAEEPLSRKDVRELIQLIRKNEIREFELVQGDLKLRIVTSAPPVEGDARPSAGANPYPNIVYSTPPGYMYPSAPPGYPAMPPPQAGVVAPPTTAAPAAPGADPTLAASPAPATPVKRADEDDPNLKKVTSPMVGTFYRAPAPDAKPYIETGMRVEEDTVLCIVEAMKLMNEIKAEMRGVVRRILVENGRPVEYGQPLFLIDPA